VRKWLARLSFSFFIVGFVLIWEMMRLRRAGEPFAPKMGAYLVGAIICIGLGFAGVRERHRSS
jgi:hypothetical protein